MNLKEREKNGEEGDKQTNKQTNKRTKTKQNESGAPTFTMTLLTVKEREKN